MSHVIDKEKIPASIRDLDWEVAVPDSEYENGDQLLVAVPIYQNGDFPNGPWRYEFAVVTVECDEHYLKFWCNDDDWEYEFGDVDFFARIKN